MARMRQRCMKPIRKPTANANMINPAAGLSFLFLVFFNVEASFPLHSDIYYSLLTPLTIS